MKTTQFMQWTKNVIEKSVNHEIVIMVFYWMNEDYTVQRMSLRSQQELSQSYQRPVFPVWILADD